MILYQVFSLIVAIVVMFDLFKINSQLSILSEAQAREVNNTGARDLGGRAGIVVFAYAVIAIVFLLANKEIQNLILLTLLVGCLVLISLLRFCSGKRLSKATVKDTDKYLSPYGWWSITNSLCFGMLIASMTMETGLSQQFMIMMVVVAGISGGAIGTMVLYSNLWIVFTVSAFLPIVFACLYLGYNGEEQGYFMALMTFIYPVFIILIGQRVANEYWRGQVAFIHLASKTRDLKSALSLLEEKESELRKHRNHLQEMVAEQTHDLRLSKEAAIEAKEEAEQANKSKSDFLANMSHELRTPIHAILSFSKIGQKKVEKVSTERLERYFSQINDSGQRLVGLIDNLLDLAKMEAVKMDYSFELMDLKKIIEQNISEQETRLQELGLTVNVLPTTCKTIAYFDPVRIGQVITNLFSNAIKFTPAGKTITLSIEPDVVCPGRRKNDGALAPALLFTIADEGIGIPEKELESVFNKFVQSSKTKTTAGGTGLGLSICKEIIDAHRGQIWAKGNETGGTSFHFLIPIKKTKTPAKTTLPSAEEKSRSDDLTCTETI